MAKPERSPERAEAVLDRASRMSRYKPSLLDRRLFDRQMRPPGQVKTSKLGNLNTLPADAIEYTGMRRFRLKDLSTMPSHETGTSPLSEARTKRLSRASVAELRAEAKRLGIKGRSKMDRPALIKALQAQPKTRAQMVAGRKNGSIPTRTGRLIEAMTARAKILSAAAGGGAGGGRSG